MPLGVMAAASVSAWWAWAFMAGVQVFLALMERLPRMQSSPAALPNSQPVHRLVLHGQVVLQAAMLGFALWCVLRQGMGLPEALALGLAAGGATGSQGITFAHELGHSRSKFDRFCGWLLMCSVCYAHFMVEHYRGHHPRAATHEDPASARQGESL